MNIAAWLPYLEKMWQRRKRGCRRRIVGCLFLLILGLLFFCGVLVWLVAPAQADSGRSLAVYLLVDNSNSLYEKGGVGSDPDLLRIDAARLFITYLGVDQSDAVHAASVIFFGSAAEMVVPLTPLSSAKRRAEIFSLIARPPRMGWTEQAAALSLARERIATETGLYRPALVLLTDGKPEWDNTPTTAEKTAYSDRLRAEGQALAALNVPIFIILLANEATDADPEIGELWQPLWQEIAATTPPGRFFIAREAADLTGIYHDIVVALTGGQTAGAVVQKPAEVAELRQVVEVEPNLARLTFVVSKSSAGVQVTILQPDGVPLVSNENVRRNVRHNVRHAWGEREEVWAVALPVAGAWTVLATGPGRVTVWKDVLPAPTRTPTQPPIKAVTLATIQVTSPPAVVTIAAPTATPESTPVPAVAAIVPAAPTKVVLAPHTKAERNIPWSLLWLLAPVSVVAAGLWHWRRRQPLVAGTLRLGGGAITATGERVIDLEALRQPRVTIGAPPADVVLEQTSERITLRPGQRVGDVHEMLITGTAGVNLDGQPLPVAMQLADDAVIHLGPYRLRYENLRWRSAVRGESWRAGEAEIHSS